ncbi:nucleolar pre-ribosomal-associated protein 1 [Rhizoctonia solani]|uniref:Nucleolar pre-ribosomal-associated protein 1 n=1 Tax=Rhizoctonia solani TaxID=456999 RepID=A0A8H8P7L1_9AGAM|nr:nucleolar pre-ribosomal-associated protein 1 [Rhizoctonia solani]QRW25283.1 nucleolar pre-ribosomal-associated protein 1 [Rhizoctonia solani]
MTKVKRPRAVQGKTTAEFKSPEGLIEALKSRNPDVLKNTLVHFETKSPWHMANGLALGIHQVDKTDVVLAALKVLGAAALIDQRLTFDAVSWTAKALPKLLSHRHRTPTSEPLVYLSIRTALVTLILALLPLTLPIELFTALFKGIAQDEGVVVKLVLETCWEKVWGDVKVPKSLKPLYDRMDPDITDPLAPADVVHHFLLALCTKPDLRPAGKDEGGEEEGSEANSKGTVYNPLLLKLLRTLRPAVDARQHELAVRILNACPDLVGAYFAKAWNPDYLQDGSQASVLLLQSSKQIFRLIPSIWMLPHTLATSSTSSRAYRADPPTTFCNRRKRYPQFINTSMVDQRTSCKTCSIGEPNTVPASTGTLVQHTTIRLITQCLLKLSNVLEAFPPGWSERAAEVVDAVRKRVPELGVVVGITQEASKALQKNEDTTMDNEVEVGSFCSQRVL